MTWVQDACHWVAYHGNWSDIINTGSFLAFVGLTWSALRLTSKSGLIQTQQKEFIGQQVDILQQQKGFIGEQTKILEQQKDILDRQTGIYDQHKDILSQQTSIMRHQEALMEAQQWFNVRGVVEQQLIDVKADQEILRNLWVSIMDRIVASRQYLRGDVIYRDDVIEQMTLWLSQTMQPIDLLKRRADPSQAQKITDILTQVNETLTGEHAESQWEPGTFIKRLVQPLSDIASVYWDTVNLRLNDHIKGLEERLLAIGRQIEKTLDRTED